MCTPQPTTGDEPPSLNGCTLTMIDQQQAILFGGKGDNEYHNDAYLLDTAKWVCCKGIVYIRPTKHNCHWHIHTISDAKYMLFMHVNVELVFTGHLGELTDLLSCKSHMNYPGNILSTALHIV